MGRQQQTLPTQCLQSSHYFTVSSTLHAFAFKRSCLLGGNAFRIFSFSNTALVNGWGIFRKQKTSYITIGCKNYINFAHLKPQMLGLLNRLLPIGCFCSLLGGFWSGSVVKNLPANAREAGLIPESERPP